MTAEIGHFALILALLVSLAQAAVLFIALRRRDPGLAMFADQAAFGAFVFMAIAFVGLTYAFVNSDFSVQVVAANSHTTKPLLYKIAGVWGNHEGSMPLWAFILTLFGAAVAMFGDNLMPGEQERLDALMRGRKMS
jgi:cytochrome c-type biogenesis protein CcmF